MPSASGTSNACTFSIGMAGVHFERIEQPGQVELAHRHQARNRFGVSRCECGAWTDSARGIGREGFRPPGGVGGGGRQIARVPGV